MGYLLLYRVLPLVRHQNLQRLPRPLRAHVDICRKNAFQTCTKTKMTRMNSAVTHPCSVPARATSVRWTRRSVWVCSGHLGPASWTLVGCTGQKLQSASIVWCPPCLLIEYVCTLYSISGLKDTVCTRRNSVGKYLFGNRVLTGERELVYGRVLSQKNVHRIVV